MMLTVIYLVILFVVFHRNILLRITAIVVKLSSLILVIFDGNDVLSLFSNVTQPVPQNNYPPIVVQYSNLLRIAVRDWIFFLFVVASNC